MQVVARGTAADRPDTLATTHLDARDTIAPASDFQDLVTRVPGVDSTGQNGLFETFSIRGTGGNSILVLLGGMPLSSQRRAGVPVAFVEPRLLGDVAVTRGPAVAHYGPGALGGAVSIEPRWFDVTEVHAGFADNGDEPVLVAATGNRQWSFAAARHDANDSQAADGTPLHTGYSRASASLQFRRDIGPFSLEALLLPSRSDDIGKSNSRFPARVTEYPHDDHMLGRLRLQHENGTELSLRGHDQSLQTWNRRPGAADTFASIESRDVNLTLQRQFDYHGVQLNLGIETLFRRDVTGFDASGSLDNRRYSLDHAREFVGSIFALADFAPTPDWVVELGTRASRSRQRETGADSHGSDAAYTAGLAWTPTISSRWSLSLSSGYRFPTLEERFFTGATAQGEVEGNPNLATEHSTGIDLGYGWSSGPWDVRTHVWSMDVDDLIQLAAAGPDQDRYVNIGSARLHGAEVELDWDPTGPWALRMTAANTRGKDRTRQDPIYGIGPPNAALEAAYERDAWSLGARYAHRQAMRRPGFEEVRRDAVDTLDAELRWRPSAQWQMRAYARNLADRRYFATADVLSALAPGRSFGFALTWSPRL